jgi:hypothetical protein
MGVVTRASIDDDYLGPVGTRLRKHAIQATDRAMVTISTGNHHRDFRDVRHV